MKHLSYILAIAGAALVASCNSDSNKWHLNGSVEGLTDSDILLVEGSNQGRWYVMDTIHPSANGKFTYAREAQGYPDIYRLRLGDKSVYFPIDSIETVTITAQAPDIYTNHTISGTPQAENLARVDSLLLASVAAEGVDATVADEQLKRKLGQMLLADPAGIVTYYIISKRIAGRALFNPAVALDNRLIGAVANAFSSQRPTDPRTAYLTRLYLEQRRALAQTNTSGTTIEANLIGAFDIKLFDNKGKEHSLLDVAGKGKPVLLNFTAYGAEWSPAFNIELNKIYEKYHGQGLEIYQVAVDEDEYAWKQTASNLPWITVLNGISDQSALVNYNVTSLPVSYVIDGTGSIVSRINGLEGIDKAVANHL